MTNYYFDSDSGNDGNTGLSEGQAWKTIAKYASEDALGTFGGGDTVYWKRGGFWRGTTDLTHGGALGFPVKWSAYGSGDLPIFDGSTLETTWVRESANVWYAAGYTVYPGMVRFDGAVGTEETVKGNLSADLEWWYDDPNNRVYVWSSTDTDPSSVWSLPGVEISSWYAITSTAISYLEFEYLDIRGGAYAGIRASVAGAASGVYMHNCQLRYNGGSGAIWSYVTTGSIYACNFEYNGCDGDWFLECDSVSVTDNTYAATNGIAKVSGDRNCIGVWNSTAIDITRNTIHQGPLRAAVVIGGTSLHGAVTITKNVLYGGASSNGIMALYYNVFVVRQNRFYQSATATYCLELHEGVATFDVSCNLFVADPAQLSGHSRIVLKAISTTTINAYCYHNTCIGNGIPFYIQGTAGLNPAASWITIKNNISYNAYVHIRAEEGTKDILTSDYNLFYLGTGTRWHSAGSNVSFATWQGYGKDAHSLTSDPLFVDAAGGDYRLSPDSPCIDAGVVIAGVTEDLDGNAIPLGVAPDIGCYETPNTAQVGFAGRAVVSTTGRAALPYAGSRRGETRGSRRFR